ncbi:MAG: molybdopterin molybdotransferase MoeA [Flavobacteriaceae bacterium]|nr:molybdopterin molybdotransferase MoeA [Flavobacteriaceae bacterium]
MSGVCDLSNENISVEKAFAIVLSNAESFGTEKVELTESFNRVLKEAIFADRDFPPFDRVSMDGIALQETSFHSGRRQFYIEGIQPAGTPKKTLKNKDHCIEVMTGAILPGNTDIVIPYEQVFIQNGTATLQIDEIKSLQNIHLKGFDRKISDKLISEDQLISPAEISVLATVGKHEVLVSKNPKIMVISTGDELVEVDKIPLEHQIRRSNVYALQALLRGWNLEAEQVHLRDDKEQLKEKIARIIEAYDVCIFSGAVSKGKFDYLPDVLDELGVTKKFHRVNQRPGKPFWFGKKDKKTFFAFPGNPVSTYLNCIKYFYPWYRKSMGLNFRNESQAILDADFQFKPSLTYFLQVEVVNKAGLLYAKPISGNGSGDLANLVECNAFLELPADQSTFKKGEAYPVLFYR